MSGRGLMVLVLLVSGACESDGGRVQPDGAGVDARANSPDSPSLDANVATLPYGGEMWVAVQTAPGSPNHYMYGGASIYSDYPLEAPPISTVMTEDGPCPPVVKKPPPDLDGGVPIDAAPGPMPTFLDVGAQVFFTASGVRLTMQKGEEGSYDSDITTAPEIEGGFLGGDGLYEVPGTEAIQATSWTMALPAPGAASVTPEAITEVEDLQYAWTPTGALAVYVDVSFLNTTTMDFYFGCACAFADDGSAAFPLQACLDTIPGAESADLAIALVRRRFERHVELEGRRLVVQAELSDQLDTPILTGSSKPADRATSPRLFWRRTGSPLLLGRP